MMKIRTLCKTRASVLVCCWTSPGAWAACARDGGQDVQVLGEEQAEEVD